MLLIVEHTVIVGESSTSKSTPVIPVKATLETNSIVPIPVASNGKANADYSDIPF